MQDGIFYPFYQNLLLLNLNKKQIPQEINERFKQTYYLHISKSADLLDRIQRVLDHIESRRIPVLLFKGPAIDHCIYDEFMRPRLDLDIAVRDEHEPALEKALIDLGYTRPRAHTKYPIPEYVNSRLFMHGSGSLMPVHVHRHLINNMFLTVDNVVPMDMRRIWEHTEPFKQYRSIYTLKPEINIVYLCEHGLKHNFEQIVFLYEIERLINLYRGRLNWKKLTALAHECGLERPAYYGLYFAKEVLSADVPQDVIDRLEPGRFTLWEKAFITNTLNKKHGRYSSYPVYLAMRTGFLGKTNFIFRTIFPPGFSCAGCLTRVFRLILAQRPVFTRPAQAGCKKCEAQGHEDHGKQE